MTSTSRKLVAFAACCAAIAVACVEKNPTVTGHRPAEVDAGAVSTAAVVPAPDESDDDAPDCRHCSETLSTDTARGTLCRKNNPSSVVLLNNLVDCVCYTKCIDDCASYCSGSRIEDSCAPCILANCADVYGACLQETKP